MVDFLALREPLHPLIAPSSPPHTRNSLDSQSLGCASLWLQERAARADCGYMRRGMTLAAAMRFHILSASKLTHGRAFKAKVERPH